MYSNNPLLHVPIPQRLGIPFRLNRESPLSKGLVAWYPTLASRATNVIRDYVDGIADLSVGTGDWNTYKFRCDAADEGAEISTPSKLKLNVPISLAYRAKVLGTPTTLANTFGVLHNNTDSSPFVSYIIGLSNTNTFQLKFNLGAGILTVNSTELITDHIGEEIFVAAVIEEGSQEIWLNGLSLKTGTNSGSAPVYGATSLVTMGDHTGVSRNHNQEFWEGLIYNRSLNEREIRYLYRHPAELYLPIAPPQYWSIPPAAPGGDLSINVDPSNAAYQLPGVRVA